MSIKPVLVPDHTANDLRRLMDHFAEAATGPTKQQLTESRAAVAAAKQAIAEGTEDKVIVNGQAIGHIGRDDEGDPLGVVYDRDQRPFEIYGYNDVNQLKREMLRVYQSRVASKGVAEGVTSPEIKQAYDAAMKTKPGTPERKRAVAHYQKLRADALAKKKQSGVAEAEETSNKVYFKVINTVGTGMPKGYHRVKTMRPLEDGGFYIELDTPGYGMDYTRHNYKNFSLKLGSPGGRPITGQQAYDIINGEPGVAEGEEQGTFAALKGWQQWNVLIMNNFYNGKYPDYSARMYGVVASSPEEARQVVLDNADYVLKDLLSKKTPNGKRWLPPKSAVPVEDKRVGQANQAKPGSLTTMGFKTMLTPDGPKSMKFSNGQIVDIQGEESAVTENVVPTEKVGSIIKRVLGKQLQWEPGVSKLYKNTRRSRTQRVDDYVMKYISTGVKSPNRLSANSGDAVPATLKKQLIQAGYPVHDDVLIFPDQIMFQVRTPISVTAESAAGKQK